VTPWAVISPARLAGTRLLRTQSDARLVDLVRAGNDRAFDAIVLRHQRPLLHHCRSLLPPGRAEDAVQQSLLHALEAMRADDREIQLGPWLHRIVHNTAIDTLRRLDSNWEELDEHMDGVEPTHAAAERRARFRSVVAGMRALPERQRRALVLRELEGRSYDEIAADIGASGDGVRQLLNRARNAMRAGAGALMPAALVGRLAGSQAGVRVAELADPPGTSALATKVTAAAAAGALALVVASGPPAGDGVRLPRAEADAAPPAVERGPDAATRSDARPGAASADPAGRRFASHDDRAGRLAGRPSAARDDGLRRSAGGAGGGSGREAFARQPADGGGGSAGQAPLVRAAPPAAPGRRSGSLGAGPTGGGEDDSSGRSPGAPVPVAASDMVDDDDAPAGGDDGAAEADVQVASHASPDDGDADDAPAPTGTQVTASQAEGDEADDEDGAGD
jgi:RNA polymerase sigma factor (sigma-70 family)